MTMPPAASNSCRFKILPYNFILLKDLHGFSRYPHDSKRPQGGGVPTSHNPRRQHIKVTPLLEHPVPTRVLMNAPPISYK